MLLKQTLKWDLCMEDNERCYRSTQRYCHSTPEGIFQLWLIISVLSFCVPTPSLSPLLLQRWAGQRTWRSTWAWWRWLCVWLYYSSWWSWSTDARRRAWMPTWRTPPSSPLASSPWASSPASQVCGHRGHAGLPPTAVGHCSLFYPLLCVRRSVRLPTMTVQHSSTSTTDAVFVCGYGGGVNVFTVVCSLRKI